VYNLQRNYGYEVAEYIQLKRELSKRKNMLLKGEITAEELKQQNDPYADKDPKPVELSKK
jgi:DNA-binding protein H-NS